MTRCPGAAYGIWLSEYRVNLLSAQSCSMTEKIVSDVWIGTLNNRWSMVCDCTGYAATAFATAEKKWWKSYDTSNANTHHTSSSRPCAVSYGRTNLFFTLKKISNDVIVLKVILLKFTRFQLLWWKMTFLSLCQNKLLIKTKTENIHKQLSAYAFINSSLYFWIF